MDRGQFPDFSWSVTRAKLFDFCPRKYYHNYYGFWGAWVDGAPEKTRLTYLAKKRTSLAAWVGQEVHAAVATYLRGNEDMDVILNQVRQSMREKFIMSRRREFMQKGNAKVFGLVEHFYEEELDNNEILERWEQVEACLQAFPQMGFREDIRAIRDTGKPVFIENPEVANFERMQMRAHELGDFAVYAQPDLVLSRKDDGVIVLDWKTGPITTKEKNDVTHQLVFNTLWVFEKFQSVFRNEFGKVEAFEVYLPGEEGTGTYRGGFLCQDHVDNAKKFAAASIKEMLDRLTNKNSNLAEENNFEAKATNRKCCICEYRIVCDKKAC